MKQIKRVLIVGGTHGNEFTGIYLVKKIEGFSSRKDLSTPNLIQRKSFECVTTLANPNAYKIVKRYVDTDLNRCFQLQDLENPNLSSYEAIRAKEIYQTFGTGGSQQADFVIDLHSTTANMGLTIILASKHPFNLYLAAYLTSKNSKVKILYSATRHQDSPHLDSICEFGCTVEVGAVAQGILDATLFQQTEELTYAILDYVEAYNQGNLPPFKDTLTIYEGIQTIDYPRNEFGEVQAMIHPKLQFRDYEPLHPGDETFITFEGEVITYKGSSKVYPVFINEAAYYEKGIAMFITQKTSEILTY
ncbi:MAG: aspartoacylase [Cyanomargarita calcarea GSE-NOS-MK-12-04C]|jgi:aspartoacylase|uniref:Probable aspartoacylase n=1 Tax=Cyanomargarita calcarea GSE-NOS-MK-12-04C TaxID=2839659 RepID=A0A951UVZ2_9CYAN|nr:aspartoacylase [Cyanomargarita calcarea GSE-NOS-MK-12-04C]